MKTSLIRFALDLMISDLSEVLCRVSPERFAAAAILNPKCDLFSPLPQHNAAN